MRQFYLVFILIFGLQSSFAQISFQRQVITTNADYAESVFAADLNGDGTKDILSYSRFDSTIAWYSNLDGFGNFSSVIVLDENVTNPGQIKAADIDGDGDNDIVYAGSFNSNSSEIYWFENLDGLGDFSERIVIADNSFYCVSLILEDLDLDGDLDIITPSSWYRNIDGNGQFSEAISIPSSVSVGLPKSISMGDFDGDGDMDLVTVRSDGGSGRTIWHENLDGLGYFYNQYSYPLIGQYGGLNDVFVTDFNSDGNPDVVVTSSDNYASNSLVRVYINSGSANFTGQTIFSGIQQKTVYASDINSDNVVDVISANSGQISWYDNAQGFSQEPVNSDYLSSIKDIFVTDIDSDGDFDILSASSGDDSIILHRNMGVLGNEIQGNVSFNFTSSDCNMEGVSISNMLISTSDGETNSFATFTLNNGNYQLPVNIGEFTTESAPIINFVSNPTSYVTEFLDLGNTVTHNFCFEPEFIANDINISVYPSWNVPRPGFETGYYIVYRNNGTTQLNGSLTFEFDDSKLQFLNASEELSSQSANTLTFDYIDFNPFETRIIFMEFNVFTPPITNIDDVLLSTATIYPITGDETEEDNVFELEQTVVGSYDPNDITVLEGDEIFIEDTDKYLHYLIRFQNTGTASAINVRVEHILDNKLDWTTMQLESLSHTGRVEIENQTDLSFIFNDINLPDSTNDEPNSHGFIAFKIKPKSNVQVGDIISGVADIYFDFNPPIITNTVSTEVVESLSIDEANAETVKLYPNPAKNRIQMTSNQVIESLMVIDINGRVLQTLEISTTDYSLDISNLSKGVYFIELLSGESKFTEKFMKN